LNRENLRNEILIFAGDLSSKSINKHLSIIGTVANISPLIGLLGTVFGVSSVLNLARMNSADLNEGISKSLIPVALGLAIGILSVIFHRFLSRVAQILSGHFENYSDSLVQSLLATKTYPKPVRDNSQRRFHQYPRQPQQQQHQSQQQRQQNRDVFRNRRNPPYKGRHIASPNKTTENIETPENRKPDPQKEEKKFFGELPN
jgi:hypothetical protein